MEFSANRENPQARRQSTCAKNANFLNHLRVVKPADYCLPVPIWRGKTRRSQYLALLGPILPVAAKGNSKPLKNHPKTPRNSMAYSHAVLPCSSRRRSRPNARPGVRPGARLPSGRPRRRPSSPNTERRSEWRRSRWRWLAEPQPQNRRRSVPAPL